MQSTHAEHTQTAPSDLRFPASDTPPPLSQKLLIIKVISNFSDKRALLHITCRWYHTTKRYTEIYQ